MITPFNNKKEKLLKWYAATGGVYAGQLVKHDSGATPAAAAHTGATLIGVAMETQTTSNGEVVLFPLFGTVLAIDYYPSSTKQTFAVTDLGTQYDVINSSNEHFVDLDDTTGGFLILVGYDNDAKVGYFAVEGADCLMNV